MSGKKIPKYSKQDVRIGFALETPTFLLIEALNAIVEILTDRGVMIKDWDDRSRTVYKFKWLGGSAFFLAPKNGTGSDNEKQ